MVFPGHFHHSLPFLGGPDCKVLSGAIRTTHGGDVARRYHDIPKKWTVNQFFMEGIVNRAWFGVIFISENDNVTVGILFVAVEFIRLCFCMFLHFEIQMR